MSPRVPWCNSCQKEILSPDQEGNHRELGHNVFNPVEWAPSPGMRPVFITEKDFGKKFRREGMRPTQWFMPLAIYENYLMVGINASYLAEEHWVTTDPSWYPFEEEVEDDTKKVDGVKSMLYPTSVLSLIVGPIRVETSADGHAILTHLQKFSRCGFLATWPFCFHVWFFWKKQVGSVSPNGRDSWLPGSERGIYFRTPGFRWDADLGMKWTWGYVGGHWD